MGSIKYDWTYLSMCLQIILISNYNRSLSTYALLTSLPIEVLNLNNRNRFDLGFISSILIINNCTNNSIATCCKYNFRLFCSRFHLKIMSNTIAIWMVFYERPWSNSMFEQLFNLIENFHYTWRLYPDSCKKYWV